MKIVCDRRIPGLADKIHAEFPDALVMAKEGSAITAADVADADALLVRTRTACNASLLEGSTVKLTGSATIGTDHIDMAWCAENGIRVVNAPGCNAPAVMQYVASSLHAAGFDPARHTLGVIGKGNIGSLITRLYRDAGTKVLVCDPPRSDAGLDDEEYLPLDEVLSRSDAVTLHVPLTVSGPYPTLNLIKGRLPERPVIIVNASRGGVVEPSLILKEHRLRKFVIDTWPFEDRPGEYDGEEIARLVNAAFIATPHIAGYSIEGKARATDAMLAALREFCGRKAESGRGEATDELKKFPYTLQETIDSFDPISLSEALKAAPGDFESLRSSHLRPEPPTMKP